MTLIAMSLGPLTTLFVKKGSVTFMVRVYGVPDDTQATRNRETDRADGRGPPYVLSQRESGERRAQRVQYVRIHLV